MESQKKKKTKQNCKRAASPPTWLRRKEKGIEAQAHLSWRGLRPMMGDKISKTKNLRVCM
jgi:hypothetical protein